MRSPGRINWGAAILLSAWLVALLLAVSKGPAWGWASGATLGLFAAAVVCAAAWIVVELKSQTPLIDMRTMRIPAVWTTNLVAVLTGAGMYAMMTFLPQLLQTPKSVAGYGLSASITQSGLYMLPLSVAMFVIGLAIGPLAAWVGPKAIVVIGSVITVPAFVMLAVGHNHGWEIYVAGGLLGIGIGLAFSSMPAIIVAAVPPAQTGAATGMNANVRTVGGAIGSAVSAVLLTSGATTAHGLPADSGYSKVFWFLAGVSLLAALAALIIPAVRAHAPESDLTPEQVTSPEPAGVAVGGAYPEVVGTPISQPMTAVVADSDAAWSIVGSVRGEQGRALPGVALTLIDQRGHQVSRVAGTTGSGYRLDAPQPGSYVLIASAAAHRPVAVTVAVGAGQQRVDLELPSSGELTGTVRRAGTGAPVPEATVTLTDARGEVVGAAITDAEGAYLCRGIAPGVHTLVVVGAGMSPRAATLTVPASGVLYDETELTPLAALAGAVQTQGRAVPNAQVTVVDSSGEPVGTARTDATGRYHVPALPAGDYTVVARGYPSVATTVTVTGATVTHDMELSYDEAAHVPAR